MLLNVRFFYLVLSKNRFLIRVIRKNQCNKIKQYEHF